MAKKKNMTLSDVYNEVARKADTSNVQINVADTKRVIACLFDVLAGCCQEQTLEFVAKGIKRSKTKKR